MPPRIYTGVFVFPVVATTAVLAGGWWTALLPALVFGLMPAMELVMSPVTGNLDEPREARAKARRNDDQAMVKDSATWPKR